MKTTKLIILIVIMAFIQPNYLSAQAFKVKNYKMTAKGTSSLHDWESVVEKLECKTSFRIQNSSLLDISEAIVKIPVKSMKSEKGKIMDNKTYDAFNSEKFPFIIFTLSSKKIDASNHTVELKGTLSMAGTTRPVELSVAYKVLSDGELQITGSKKLKMTDFKMEPPTAMMGTIKVGDEVVVDFNLILTNTLTTL